MTKPKSKQNAKKAITSDHLALRELRLECGMTLKEADEKYGLTSKGMGAIENGRIELSEERIRHIVKSYGYKFSDFKDAMEKVELRDMIIDNCLENIDQLDDTKLEIVKNLLGSF